MTKASLSEIIQSLNVAGVRYLVVGGIAVNAHGYYRSTVDVDLLIQLERANVVKALNTLIRIGYRTTIPVTVEDFADPAVRYSWITEKQMKVLKLVSDAHRETDIDVFVSDPLGFDDAYARAHFYPLTEGVEVPVCGYDDLVKLKLLASRPQDLADLDQLRIARGEA
jgi:predicted nucleotidyltransferase